MNEVNRANSARLSKLFSALAVELNRDIFTYDPTEAKQPPEDNVAWEPMEQYGETDEDRLYWRDREGEG